MGEAKRMGKTNRTGDSLQAGIRNPCANDDRHIHVAKVVPIAHAEGKW